jgi:hypothetical protein
MSQCYAIAPGEGRPLLVQELERFDDGTFMGQVLVTVLSSHFNKLPEVALLDYPPIRVDRAHVLYEYAVINLSEFASGPERPDKKCAGHLMFHTGVERVAAIASADFPLMRVQVGAQVFAPLPNMNALLCVINEMNSAVKKRFAKQGASFTTRRVSCSHGAFAAILSRLGGVLGLQKGYKQAQHHSMNRPSVVSITNNSSVLKVTEMCRLQGLLGMCQLVLYLYICLCFN